VNKIISRMGDGWVVALSEAALKRELEDGTLDAAVQGEIEPLPEDELKYLFEICRSGNKMTGVEAGREVVLSYDGPTFEIRRLGILANRQTALQIYERCFGADTLEFSQIDYSYKQVKLVENAGAHIFGAVINTQTRRSFPWNLARSVTFCKACTAAANIPVHGNMGMGVGSLPVCEAQPAETVSMASKGNG
jgi:hypothetical protein